MRNSHRGPGDLLGHAPQLTEHRSVLRQLHLQEGRIDRLWRTDDPRRLRSSATGPSPLQDGPGKLARAILVHDQPPPSGHEALDVPEREIGGQSDVIQVLGRRPAGHPGLGSVEARAALQAKGLESPELELQLVHVREGVEGEGHDAQSTFDRCATMPPQGPLAQLVRAVDS